MASYVIEISERKLYKKRLLSRAPNGFGFSQIQCKVRGFLQRKNQPAVSLGQGTQRSADNVSATGTERTSGGGKRHSNGRRRSRPGNRQLDKYLSVVAVNQAREGGGAGEGGGGGGYSDWCACRIQAWWRMINER